MTRRLMRRCDRTKGCLTVLAAGAAEPAFSVAPKGVLCDLTN